MAIKNLKIGSVETHRSPRAQQPTSFREEEPIPAKTPPAPEEPQPPASAPNDEYPSEMAKQETGTYALPGGALVMELTPSSLLVRPRNNADASKPWKQDEWPAFVDVGSVALMFTALVPQAKSETQTPDGPEAKEAAEGDSLGSDEEEKGGSDETKNGPVDQ